MDGLGVREALGLDADGCSSGVVRLRMGLVGGLVQLTISVSRKTLSTANVSVTPVIVLNNRLTAVLMFVVTVCWKRPAVTVLLMIVLMKGFMSSLRTLKNRFISVLMLVLMKV